MPPDRYIGQFRPAFSRLYRDADLRWLIPLPTTTVVSVVGDRLAGKSQVVTFLEERHGFRIFRVQDYVREVALRRGVPVDDRYLLQQFADALRAEHGEPDFLAAEVARRARRRLLAEALPGSIGPPIGITGLKHYAEVDLLRPITNFHLLRVDASPQRRLARAIAVRRLPAGSTLDDLHKQLDVPEREGVDSRFDEVMRGRMRVLLERNADVPLIDNDHDDPAALQSEVVRVLRELRIGQRDRD